MFKIYKYSPFCFVRCYGDGHLTGKNGIANIATVAVNGNKCIFLNT